MHSHKASEEQKGRFLDTVMTGTLQQSRTISKLSICTYRRAKDCNTLKHLEPRADRATSKTWDKNPDLT